MSFIGHDLLQSCVMTPTDELLVSHSICPHCVRHSLKRNTTYGGLLFRACCICKHIWVTHNTKEKK